MKVLILGFGRFGRNVASAFINEGHEVTIVDSNEKLAKSAEENYDLKAVVGNCSHPEVLKAAGAATADLLLAATKHDEANIVACYTCSILYQNLTKKIARIQTEAYIDQHQLLLKNNYIDKVITPEFSIAENLFKLADFPGTAELIDLENLYLFGVRVSPNAELLGQSPKNISDLLEKEEGIWLAAVCRDRLLMEQCEDLSMQAYDMVYLCSTKKPPSRLISLFGQNAQRGKNVLVLGGGGVGLKLAQLLFQKGFQTTVVEENEERAKFVAARNSKLDVRHQDALHESLREIVKDDQDWIAIGVTDKDEVNLLSLLMIKGYNPKVRTISMLNRKNLSNLLPRFQLDVGVFTHNIILPLISEYLSRNSAFGMNYPMLNCDAYCLLIEAAADSFLVGRDLQILWNNYKILSIAVKRKESVLHPREVVELEIGDVLICLVSLKNLEKVKGGSFSRNSMLL